MIDVPYLNLTEDLRAALNKRIGPQAADLAECLSRSPDLGEDETWRDVKWLNEAAEEYGISPDTMTRYRKLFRENKDWVTELLNLK